MILGIVCRLRGVLDRNDGMRSQKWELPNLLRPFPPGSAGAMFHGPAMKTREALWRLAFGCGLGHYHRCGMVPGGVSWRQDGNFVSGNGRNGYGRIAIQFRDICKDSNYLIGGPMNEITDKAVDGLRHDGCL